MENISTIEGEQKYEVLKPQPSDARGIQEVFYKTWLATYPNEEYGITVEDIEDRYKNSLTEVGIQKLADRIENLPENTIIYIAKVRDEVVGVCRGQIEKDFNELGAIYVLPEHQNKGIGKKMWLELEKNFDPSKDTIVRLAIYNKATEEVYKRFGFVDTGKRLNDERFRLKSGAIIPEIEMIKKAISNGN